MLSLEHYRYKLLINGFSVNEPYYFALNRLVKTKHNNDEKLFIEEINKNSVEDYINKYATDSSYSHKTYDYAAKKYLEFENESEDNVIFKLNVDYDNINESKIIIERIVSIYNEDKEEKDKLIVKEVKKGCIQIYLGLGYGALKTIYFLIKYFKNKSKDKNKIKNIIRLFSDLFETFRNMNEIILSDSLGEAILTIGKDAVKEFISETIKNHIKEK